MRSDIKETIDHPTIRKWAEERGGKPALVKEARQEGEVVLLRLQFPDYASENTLTEISWQEFFKRFDEQKLAFEYQDYISSGEKSHLFKLIRRDIHKVPGEDQSLFLTKHEDKKIESDERLKQLKDAKTQGSKKECKDSKDHKEAKGASSKTGHKGESKVTAKKAHKATHK